MASGRTGAVTNTHRAKDGAAATAHERPSAKPEWLSAHPSRDQGQRAADQAARAYLRGMLQKAGIDKKISPHKLRHYSACRIMPNLGVQADDALAW